MKTHITINQLKSLSKVGRVKLMDWLKSNPDKSGEYKWAEQLSIEQMIEFLNQNSITCQENDNNLCLFDNNKENYCDALWELVKKILEK